MCSVKFRGDMNREPAPCQGLGREFRIRSRRQEISSQSKEDLNLPAMHRFDGLDGIFPVNPRRLELVAQSKSVEESRSGFFPYSYSSVSLTVAMAPNRADPRTRFSDVSPEQEKIDDLSNGGDG